jgi:magnesium transporter
MIRSYPHAEAPWSGAIWIDLCNATDAERAEVERVTGARVPTQAAISEIETSSRVYLENGVLYLSTPLPASGDARESLSAVGFVLSERLLLTLRFSENSVFDALYAGCVKTGPHSASDVFLRILEALVDRSADTLEHTSAELDTLSQRTFHADGARTRSVKQASEALRHALRKLGQMGDWISQIRDTLLGLGRIAAFVSETGDVLSAQEVPRLKAVRADITSLNDYQAHLLGKVQFLLDATLGFINIEQNDIVKTLTIVSVVGVPPVLVAGIYGMNFKFMPELGWSLGYPFALLLMVVTGLLPLAWFKWRGWM